MRKSLLSGATFLALAAASPAANAFCGFYVAKADAKLFNKASKVVVARSGERTVVTMASDYQGEPKDFAVVVPVPTVIKKEQIHITENALVDHVDAYSAPRLVEYFDPDPCAPVLRPMMKMARKDGALVGAAAPTSAARAKALGVTIEAEYTVGEYDIQILSAKQSDGLETFLVESGYKIPQGASAVLGSYLKQDMKFFVAKVNLKEKAKLGRTYLRPIQVAYETHKFMLPIRLGTVNADGPQELFVFMLTEKGRVETTNYRTIRIPSNLDVPLYTKKEFPAFYRAMFDTQVKKEDMRGVYLEYAWNMGWCDPCAADPIPNDKLVELGAFWLASGEGSGRGTGSVMPRRPGGFVPPRMGTNAYITRLHLRYDAAHFPEDLMFHETADTANFQGRYVLRHPFTGPAKCEAGKAYRKGLRARFDNEAANLARLTGWEMADIRAKMEKNGQSLKGIRSDEDDTESDVKPGDEPGGKPWYEKMWDGKKPKQ